MITPTVENVITLTVANVITLTVENVRQLLRQHYDPANARSIKSRSGKPLGRSGKSKAFRPGQPRSGLDLGQAWV